MTSILFFYFFSGLASLTAVADIHFSKEMIHLSAEQLISLGIWVGLPWSIKILFGSILDSLPLNRRFWSIVGQVIMLAMALTWIDMTSTQYLLAFAGEFKSLLLIGFFSNLGLVLTRLSFDTQSIEHEDLAVRKKLQVYTRLAMVLGALLGALLTGWLATRALVYGTIELPIRIAVSPADLIIPHYLTYPFHMWEIYAIAAFCIGLSLLSTLMTKPMPLVPKDKPKEIKAIGLALIYSIGITALGLSLSDTNAQLAIFTASLIGLSWFLSREMAPMEKSSKIYLALSLMAIFLFRASPSTGPGPTWYYMDVLKLDDSFFGSLRIIEALVSIVLLGGLKSTMTEKNLGKSLTILTVLITFLQLPDILVYYHLIGNLNPRHLLLVDGAAVAGISQLAMVPLGILIAVRAPEGNKAMFFSLTSSLMNLAMVAGDIMGKVLNHLFIVVPARNGNPADYSQLGKLLIYSTAGNALLSILGLIILYYGTKQLAKE